jgi:hypothetical protein
MSPISATDPKPYFDSPEAVTPSSPELQIPDLGQQQNNRKNVVNRRTPNAGQCGTALRPLR